MRWGIVLICVVFLCSCTTRIVTPSRASRRAIDTIYQQRIVVLQPHMDSMCALFSDSLYVVAVDSILTQRTREMSDLVK